MAPTAEEVRSRAVQLQDILSAFDERVLPSEYKLSIVENILSGSLAQAGLIYFFRELGSEPVLFGSPWLSLHRSTAP